MTSGQQAFSPAGPRRTGLGGGLWRSAKQTVDARSASAGRPLHSDVRAFFEGRFGYDLSRVRVHSDAESAELADRLGARAWTVKQNVFFARGQFKPRTQVGRALLGHELAHVVQQRGEPPTASLEISKAGEHAELEADRAGSRAAAGGTPANLSRQMPKIYRQAQQPTSGPEAGPGQGGEPDERAYHGIDMAYTADLDFGGTHSPSKPNRLTLYWIAAQLRNATGKVVAYIAYNPQSHRNEWVIGPGDLAFFTAHERMFFGLAQATYPAVGDMPAYKAESAKVGTRAMRGDVAGAFRALRHSWSLAGRDPDFWVSAAMATAGGLAAGAEGAEGAAARRAVGKTPVPPADVPPADVAPTPAPTADVTPTPAPTAEPSPAPAPAPTTEPTPTPAATTEPTPAPAATTEPTPAPAAKPAVPGTPARPPLPRKGPELPDSNFRVWKEPLHDEQLAREQSQIMKQIENDPRQATRLGNKYRDLVDKDLQPTSNPQRTPETFGRAGRRPDIGTEHEVTLEGSRGGFSSSKLDQIWKDLIEKGRTSVTVPRLSELAESQLRRLGMQAQQQLGKQVYIAVRQTAP